MWLFLRHLKGESIDEIKTELDDCNMCDTDYSEDSNQLFIFE